jgi:hypothetical protein
MFTVTLTRLQVTDLPEILRLRGLPLGQFVWWRLAATFDSRILGARIDDRELENARLHKTRIREREKRRREYETLDTEISVSSVSRSRSLFSCSRILDLMFCLAICYWPMDSAAQPIRQSRRVDNVASSLFKLFVFSCFSSGLAVTVTLTVTVHVLLLVLVTIDD